MPLDIVKLDAQKQKQITQDWLALFPEYKKEKAGLLSKRIGPIVLSLWYIIDSRGRPEYKMNGSVFNLSNPLEQGMCANLSFRANKSHLLFIHWQKHEQGYYKELADSLRITSPIPLEGPVTLTQVINAYKERYGKSGFSKRELEDPALIAAWAGKLDLAKSLADWGLEAYRREQEEYTQRTGEIPKIDPYPWYQELLNRIKDSQALRQIVDEQVVKLKLTKVPYQDLVID